MNHNPHNLQQDTKVLLDGRHEVIIHSFTVNQLLARIYSEGQKEKAWQCMTNRLTPLTEHPSLIDAQFESITNYLDGK